MGSLPLSEMSVIFMIPLVYLFVVPVLFSIALRIFLWFAKIMGVAEAFGRFGSTMVDSFRSRQAAKIE